VSGKTAGQQAYEAFVAWRAERDPMMICTDWTHPAVAHEGWEAVAATVETGQVRLAREDRDQLRKQVLDLAAALEAEGAEEIAIARKRQGPADEIDKNRGRVFKLCASRIRKIAGPPS
jgi:hypothetical protein